MPTPRCLSQAGSRGPSGIIGRVCPPVRGGRLPICVSVQSGDGLSPGSGQAEAAQPLAGPPTSRSSGHDRDEHAGTSVFAVVAVSICFKH